jgi:5'-methylthioadenosine phosphorylase
MSIIGMTTSPEAFLAREAEICYSVMAHVTDYDVWHVSDTPVTVDMVIDTLSRNASTAQKAIRYLATNPVSPRDCGCESALSSSLISDPSHISPATKQRLHLLIEKYIK